MTEKKTTKTTETFKVRGDELVSKVRELLREGSVRRIVIKDKSGKDIMNIPVAIGIVGTLIAPAFAILGTAIALLTECTITVEREG